MTTLSELREKSEIVARELEAFGAAEAATAVRETAERLQADLVAWWNESLTIAQAAAWGGYSESQLRRLVHDGKIPRTDDGGIRRRHVPIQPGHEPPLGLEPARPGVTSIADDIAKRRAA